MSEIVSHERIENRIHELRGKKVMFDRDLAELYGVKAIALRQQVKRNAERFPGDFMFQLTDEELDAMVSQKVIASRKVTGGSLPLVFTEQGVAMLSSVLKSSRAVQVNIQIMRTFSKMREMMQGYRELVERIQKIEKRQDVESRAIWKAITLLQSTVMK
jgi:hypothetical protein